MFIQIRKHQQHNNQRERGQGHQGDGYVAEFKHIALGAGNPAPGQLAAGRGEVINIAMVQGNQKPDNRKIGRAHV